MRGMTRVMVLAGLLAAVPAVAEEAAVEAADAAPVVEVSVTGDQVVTVNSGNEAVDAAAKTVTFADGRVEPYDVLMTTLPMDKFAHLTRGLPDGIVTGAAAVLSVFLMVYSAVRWARAGPSNRVAASFGSSWRIVPAAELRGFMNVGRPFSAQARSTAS